MPILVSIVEDNEITSDYIVVLLKGANDLQFVGSHRSSEEALKSLPLEKPDVVLMDINLPRMSGVECVRNLKKLLPTVKVVMLTGDDRDDRVFESLKAGANGYLSKDASPSDIIQAVIDAQGGGAPMSREIASKVVSFFHTKGKATTETTRLTDREREILELLSKGLLYKEIAEKLGISYQTVNGHIKNIYEKLHVHSRSEAISKYLQA